MKFAILWQLGPALYTHTAKEQRICWSIVHKAIYHNHTIEDTGDQLLGKKFYKALSKASFCDKEITRNSAWFTAA